MQNRIQGFGSTNASASNGRAGGRGAYGGLGGADNGDDSGDSFPSASTGLGSKKMEGFGNPRYAASSGYRPAAPGSGGGGLAAAAWEGAVSGASTALAGAGTALQGASSAFSHGPLAGATTVLTGAGNALSSAGNALSGALSPKASSAAARRGREARPMLDAVCHIPGVVSAAAWSHDRHYQLEISTACPSVQQWHTGGLSAANCYRCQPK